MSLFHEALSLPENKEIQKQVLHDVLADGQLLADV